MKIPTILGLALLITAVILGLILINFQGFNNSSSSTKPDDIRAVNMTDSSATIIWFTKDPVIGEVNYGEGNNLKDSARDDRDNPNFSNRTTHFVTINSLQPGTEYRYRIKSNGTEYNDSEFHFKTAPKPIDLNNALTKENQDLYQPLQGSVVNQNLEVIDDGIVVFKLDGSSEQATYITTAGNFFLPLANLRTSDLSDLYPLNKNTTVRILIRSQDLESNVDLNLPFPTQSIPPIKLGENLDLKSYSPTNFSENPSFTTPQVPQKLPVNFDLNGDGDINSLDLALLNQNRSRKTTDKKFDLNGDEKIDSADVILMQEKLKQKTSK